jgi:hypothetical protein
MVVEKRDLISVLFEDSKSEPVRDGRVKEGGNETGCRE